MTVFPSCVAEKDSARARKEMQSATLQEKQP
jgi:hypothetical protein